MQTGWRTSDLRYTRHQASKCLEETRDRALRSLGQQITVPGLERHERPNSESFDLEVLVQTGKGFIECFSFSLRHFRRIVKGPDLSYLKRELVQALLHISGIQLSQQIRLLVGGEFSNTDAKKR